MPRLTGFCSFRSPIALMPSSTPPFNMRLSRAWAGILITGSLLTGCDVSNEGGLGTGQDKDPVVVDLPIAFVARDPLPYLNDDGDIRRQDILDPTAFFGGAELVIKDRGQASAPERIVTEGIFEPVLSDPDDDDSELVPARVDIRDIEVSYDGTRILFAMRQEDTNPDDDIETTWNLWEHDTLTGETLPLLDANSFPANNGHDVSPSYLPDGRIVFSSTRQSRSREILQDEGKPQYSSLAEARNAEAFNLHVYDRFNVAMSQISFNPSHDLQPTVLNDGRISFLRWDTAGGKDRLSLFTVKPDGTQLERYFGYNSQTTTIEVGEELEALNTALWHAKPFDDTRLIANLRARDSAHWGGDIITVDTEGFIDNETPNPRMPGSGSAIKRQVTLDINLNEATAAFSPGGFYNSAHFVNDGTERLLVSWSPCRLYAANDDQTYPCNGYLDREDGSPAAPSYGIWMLDPAVGTQRPIKPPTEAQIFTDVVVLEARPLPNNIASATDDILAAEGLGVLHIRNIYDFDGTLAPALSPMPHEAPREERPERFIRLVKPVALPDDEVRDFPNSAFGINRSQRMRDILGYVPIEPDGSAKFTVPADVPFTINVVDATGKRIGGRHNHWLSVKAGEQRDCVGCHINDDEENAGHGRQDAELFSDYLGAPFSGILLRGAAASPLTGQSMAEYYADTFGPREPSLDLIYRDIWTAESSQAEADIRLRYADINPDSEENLQPANNAMPCLEARPAVAWQRPTASSCGSAPAAWRSSCRITINYEAHIHPLWERDRRSCDELGETVTDGTCTTCHSKTREDEFAMPLAPAGNLFLTGEPASANDYSTGGNGPVSYISSYANLFYGRWEWEINDAGMLARRSEEQEVEVPIVDGNGDPVLDAEGNPTTRTELRTVFFPVPRLMATGTSRDESGFFDLFSNDDPIHNGLLSANELRLIAEWLDIGAQYYNNPFDAPEN